MMRSNLLSYFAAVCVLGPLAAFAGVAQATKPAFEMPFPCGQAWRGNTYDYHKLRYAVDLNRGASPRDDLGDTVVASASGAVSTSTYSTTTGYGNYIVINHGGGWTSWYAHLNSRSVSAGESVSRGERIGTVGETTRPGNDITPHLHYEQRYNNDDKPIVWNGSQIYYDGERTYTSRNCDGNGSGTTTGRVNTESGVSLNVRSGPSTSASIVGSVADGAAVSISCQTRGQTVTGTYGTSDLWNKISSSSARYIPDVYTYTGSDGRVAPDC